MKKGILFLSLLVALGGCGFNRFGDSKANGSGVMKVEKRTVPAFKGVNVSGAYEVEIVAQKEQSLEVEGDENLLSLIKTEVRDGVLEISNARSFNTRNKLRVRISVPVLDSIRSSGASDVMAANVKSDEFSIETSGAGKLQVSGDAKAVEVTLSGAGDVYAKELRAERVKVTSSGAATAEVYATEELKASVSGVGNIEYYGDPKSVSENKSGVGSITKR